MVKKPKKTFFDLEYRQQKISNFDSPLKLLKTQIDWEAFRPTIESGFEVRDISKGGRPPYDKVLLFKIMILQHFYALSEEQAEFQIADRFSFMDFLSLELHDAIPDSNTIRNFREALTQADIIDQLFVEFNHRLNKVGLIGKEGRIVDATFVAAPKQRNSRAENQQIKEGKTPRDWSDKKKAHKDVDAAWTKKNDETHYGYKDHIKTDTSSNIILDYQVTPANVHDSQVLDELLMGETANIVLHGDSAYSGKDQAKILGKRNITNQIHEKGSRNKPLTEQQKQSNHQKSKTRAKVEHAFAWMHRNCQQIMVRTIGLARATAKIALLNLLWNMTRSIQLMKSRGNSLPV